MQRTPCLKRAFSLVEVVLAIGVLSLAVVALLGLFGPTIGSVKQVVDSNLATAAVTRINTQIQRELDWGTARDATRGESLFYIWKRQATSGGPIELVMSDPDSTTGTLSDETSNATVTTDLSNGTLIGTPLVVTFQPGMSGQYNFDNVDDEGYFPILVNIYAIEPSLIGTGSYSDRAGIEANLDPIFTYTTAKNR